ncbi:MAG: hypothetical protein LC777_12480 [Actinobacteria bacterium]|nr:hypothetical protein [Actinomycetota bacterium]
MPASQQHRDVLQVTARELRDTIRVTIDRELIDALDERRQSLSRSQYLELVLRVALERPDPHLPEHYSPEDAAKQRYARARRYLQTGR